MHQTNPIEAESFLQRIALMGVFAVGLFETFPGTVELYDLLNISVSQFFRGGVRIHTVVIIPAGICNGNQPTFGYTPD